MKNYSITDAALRRARPADGPDISRLLRLAFGFDEARATEYVGHAGEDGFFILGDGRGTALGCAALLTQAHAFGGGCVPAVGIAHVALAPEARGRGLARPLMTALCDEARGRGAAMVSLFASARPVYRKCGFELAGSEIVYEADLSAVPQAADAVFEPIDPQDPRIAAAYSRKVAAGAGLLRREAVHWRELLRPPTDGLAAYGIAGADGLDAYVILDARGHPACLNVRDWHAADGTAAKALLAFLGRFRSEYAAVRWHGGPQDDLVDAMQDKGWRIAHREDWMANILDPKAALFARRYLPESATFGLRLTGVDGRKAASIVLKIDGGTGQASDGPTDGLPTVTVGRAAFASLFTGFRSATALARQGVLTGDDRSLRMCDVVFAGPAPWVAEHF